MNGRSRASLFLMEQLIVVAVFAVCASVCVNLFAGSFLMVRNSRDVKNALLIARSAAECYKASAGDAEEMRKILGGGICGEDDSIAVYYDEEMQVCSENGAAYVMRLTNQSLAGDTLVQGELAVETVGGDLLIAFSVAARRENNE